VTKKDPSNSLNYTDSAQYLQPKRVDHAAINVPSPGAAGADCTTGGTGGGHHVGMEMYKSRPKSRPRSTGKRTSLKNAAKNQENAATVTTSGAGGAGGAGGEMKAVSFGLPPPPMFQEETRTARKITPRSVLSASIMPLMPLSVDDGGLRSGEADHDAGSPAYFDASDVATPRGISAIEEVKRLRMLLAGTTAVGGARGHEEGGGAAPGRRRRASTDRLVAETSDLV
jgi:hypothetical protein